MESMRRAVRPLCLFVLAGLSLGALPAQAVDGVFLSAPNRVDSVHDPLRDYVYISSGSQILVYSLKYNAFRTPITIPFSQLGGIDLSPDGRTLVVADRAASSIDGWVWLVDLGTLEARKLSFLKDNWGEWSAFTAVYGGDGMVYTTSTFSGSGWVPFRRIDPVTGAVTKLAEICQDTMLQVSGDGNVIAFAESNISDGRWGTYTIPTQTLVQRQWYENGTSWFNYEITVDRTGSRYFIPTYGGGFVYDANYKKVGTLGVYAGPQPNGGVFHPVEPLLYTPWVGSPELRVYDADTLALVDTYIMPGNFSSPGNYAFGNGRTRISRDGSLLMVSVPDGVQVIRQYAPLKAEPATATVNPGGSVDIPLVASVGNGGALGFELVGKPLVGKATISGSTLHYVAPKNWISAVALRYRAVYGRATAEADVRVDIVPAASNRPPVLRDHVVHYAGQRAQLVTVMAGSRDPDGDVLRLVGAAGAQGRLALDGHRVRYTPGRADTETFTYSVSDGHGGLSQARVTMVRSAPAPATRVRNNRR